MADGSVPILGVPVGVRDLRVEFDADNPVDKGLGGRLATLESPLGG
jgi:hypothetical protein